MSLKFLGSISTLTGGTAKEWKVDVVLPKARLRVLNDTTTQTAMAAMLYGR